MKQKRELFFSIIVAGADSEGDGSDEIDPDEVVKVVNEALAKKYGDDFIGSQYNDEEWGEVI